VLASGMPGKFWFGGASRVVGYRAASEFRTLTSQTIGNADDERLSSCSVAAGGVHRGLPADGTVQGAEACI
jgi:hypothetical protein